MMQRILDIIVYRIVFIYNFLLNGFKIKTALFYPRKPSHKAILYKILKKLNYNVTINPNSNFQIAVNWLDATFREHDDTLKSVLQKSGVLNSDCFDISKSYIGKVFEEVFNYPILIDPRHYNGSCIRKNNLNARKEDSKILDCPVNEIEDGFVYVKLVNTKINEEHVLDYRVPVIGNSIPLIYLKTKPFATLFQSQTVDLQIAKPQEYLSDDEIKKIVEFCRRIGLDTGELDVLRDNKENRIYIVDANNTPWGPPRYLSKQDSKKALKILTRAFKQEFIN